MAIETFPAILLSRGSGLETRVRTLSKSLGDGYVQVAADGINNQPRSYRAVFDTRAVAEIDQIVEFLAARGGVEAFLFDPPDAPAGLKWRCERWQQRWVSATHRSLTATFIEDFAP